MRLFRASALLALVSTAVFAQNAALMPSPKMQFFNASGVPLAGGMIYTCVAGSSCPGTPQAAYTDYTGGTALPNPVVLDSGGFASIWLGSSAYKIVATDANGVQQWSVDQVSVPAMSLLTGAAPLASLTVTGNASIGGTLSVTGAATIGGNSTIGGSLGVGGALSAASLSLTNNATIGGTLSVTGTATIGGNEVLTGSLVAGSSTFSNLYAANTPLTSVATGGAYIGWAYQSGIGETDFWNSPGSWGGGFAWYNTASTSSATPLMALYGFEGGRLEVNDIELAALASGTQPTCQSNRRGLVFIVQGNGSTTADSLQVCILQASGSYAWKTVF